MSSAGADHCWSDGRGPRGVGSGGAAPPFATTFPLPAGGGGGIGPAAGSVRLPELDAASPRTRRMLRRLPPPTDSEAHRLNEVK